MRYSAESDAFWLVWPLEAPVLPAGLAAAAGFAAAGFGTGFGIGVGFADTGGLGAAGAAGFVSAAGRGGAAAGLAAAGGRPDDDGVPVWAAGLEVLAGLLVLAVRLALGGLLLVVAGLVVAAGRAGAGWAASAGLADGDCWAGVAAAGSAAAVSPAGCAAAGCSAAGASGAAGSAATFRDRSPRPSGSRSARLCVIGALLSLSTSTRAVPDAMASFRALSSARWAARRASALASALFFSGPITITMFRPSMRGVDSTAPTSATSSANFWSKRMPISGRCCSRPRNWIMALTLSPAPRKRRAWPRLVS